jgi:hypothetical protein
MLERARLAAEIARREADRPWLHRIRTFKLSKDPRFAVKLRTMVGLYVGLRCMALKPVGGTTYSTTLKSAVSAARWSKV